ncbi:CPBP family intramembrane metalloprotease [candidate division WOR-3 bacterium]|nr:CPBP family intramembrane metalloprotease [candidate division WOR-3 bacterium]
MTRDQDNRFLGYYWGQLKALFTPATPLIVTAIYSFVLIFEREHHILFQKRFYGWVFELFGLDITAVGSQEWFPVVMGLRGLWYMLIPLIAIAMIRLLTVLPQSSGKHRPLPRKRACWLDSLGMLVPISLNRGIPCISKGARKAFPQYRFSDYGFRIGRWIGWRDSVIFLGIMVPFVVFAVFQKDFSRMYPLAKIAERSFLWFIIWEALHLLHMFGWEFLNRGFLLFALEEKMGYWAILATAVPFAILHLGKPELEAYGSFIAAIALGWLALRTRSFLPGVFLHWSVALVMDFLAVVMSGGSGG